MTENSNQSDPCDEAPLPSLPVLTEEETARQLRDDFCRGYKRRAESAEAKVARLTRELGMERQGRPTEQPLLDVPLDRQIVLLNRQLDDAKKTCDEMTAYIVNTQGLVMALAHDGRIEQLIDYITENSNKALGNYYEQ